MQLSTLLSNHSQFQQNQTTSTSFDVNIDDLVVVAVWSSILVYGLATNLLVVVAVLRHATLRSTTSYWFMISLSICDIAMIVISLVHLIPATALHDSYVDTFEMRNFVALFLYNIFWYTGVLTLGAVALNRFISIMYPLQFSKLFSSYRTAYIILLLYFLGSAVALPSLFECCYTVWDHQIYATYYLDARANDTYGMADLAINAATVAVMLICYTFVIVKVRRSRQQVRRHTISSAPASTHFKPPPAVAAASTRLRATPSARLSVVSSTTTMQSNCSGCSTAHVIVRTGSNHSNSANYSPNRCGGGGGGQGHVTRREIRLFIQFLVVSALFMSTWVTWQLAFRIPQQQTSKWFYFVMTTLFYINNSTNPTIYLIFNTTLRKEIKRLLLNTFKGKNDRRGPGATFRTLAAVSQVVNEITFTRNRLRSAPNIRHPQLSSIKHDDIPHFNDKRCSLAPLAAADHQSSKQLQRHHFDDRLQIIR